MDKLLSVADAYGGKATIYCTFEFAATMIPSDVRWASDSIKNTLWNNGYLGNYKGHNVIILPQSFEDDKNKVKMFEWFDSKGIYGNGIHVVKADGTEHLTFSAIITGTGIEVPIDDAITQTITVTPDGIEPPEWS